jgi:DNA repair exonuclease SbcCD ATPase subunit
MLFKKVAAGVAGALVVGGFIFGKDFVSYVRTAGTEVQEAVKGSVPMEFELKRAKDLLANIDPEIKSAKTTVARQDVDIEDLKGKIAKRVDGLTKDRSELLTRRDELKVDKTTFLVSNKSYTRDQLESDLKSRLNRVKQSESTLSEEEKLLTRKEAAAEANRQKLDFMMKQKKELELKIEWLQARLDQVKATEAVHDVAIDDSEFTRVKNLVDQIDKDLKVREKVVDTETTPADGLIPVESKDAPKGVLDEVDAYLGNNNKTGNVAERN